MIKTVCVELVQLSGVHNISVDQGTTITDFRSQHGISSNIKILNYEGDILQDDYVITEPITLITAVSKRNA